MTLENVKKRTSWIAFAMRVHDVGEDLHRHCTEGHVTPGRDEEACNTWDRHSTSSSETPLPTLCCYHCRKTSCTCRTLPSALAPPNQQRGHLSAEGWGLQFPPLTQSAQQLLERSCRHIQTMVNPTMLFQEKARSRLKKKQCRTLIFQVYKTFQRELALCIL